MIILIKFAGRTDNNIKKKVLKQRDRQIGWAMLIASAVCAFLTIYLWIVEQRIDYEFLAFTVVLLLLSFILFFIPNNNNVTDWFYTVCITDKVIQKTQYKQPMLTLEMDQVKRVRDDGKYYSIIYADISNAIICQKSLLVEGTLEEFEALFEGKIVRKKSKK